MSTSLRRAVLKALRMSGVKSFKARSGLGYPFLCQTGDFAGEVPFYNRSHSRLEIQIMAELCEGCREPLVFDVGANVGYVATQLAQAVKTPHLRIIAFEPVYDTFAKLTQAVRRLGLQSRISPICCAVSDRGGGICSVAFNERDSLFAQVRNDTLNFRAGSSLAWSSEVTIDAVVESIGKRPIILKIDVEGFEAHVLRGASGLLQGPDAPFICFELNPLTLGEVGSSVEAIAAQLHAYRLFYMDDFEGQRVAAGKEITDLGSLSWCCNILASPSVRSDAGIRGLFSSLSPSVPMAS
jgi:FkbM family methyltransferase